MHCDETRRDHADSTSVNQRRDKKGRQDDERADQRRNQTSGIGQRQEVLREEPTSRKNQRVKRRNVTSGGLREAGANRDWQFCTGVRRAVLRFLAVWLGLNGVVMAMGTAAGVFGAWWILGLPFGALTVPVNPQGRGDFYLAREAA